LKRNSWKEEVQLEKKKADSPAPEAAVTEASMEKGG